MVEITYQDLAVADSSGTGSRSKRMADRPEFQHTGCFRHPGNNIILAIYQEYWYIMDISESNSIQRCWFSTSSYLLEKSKLNVTSAWKVYVESIKVETDKVKVTKYKRQKKHASAVDGVGAIDGVRIVDCVGALSWGEIRSSWWDCMGAVDGVRAIDGAGAIDGVG